MQRVVLGGERPKMDSHHTADWPENLIWLMKRCWSPSACARPSFADVKEVLKDVLDSKEKLPNRLASLPSEGASEEHPEHCPKMVKPSGIAALFRSPRNRSKSIGKGTVDGIKRPEKSGRSKTWSFSLLR